MKRNFSLRRRLVLSLLGVFLLGVAATAIFYRWELQEIKDELRHLPTGAVPLNIQFNEMVEGDIEFLGYILIPFTVVAMGVHSSLPSGVYAGCVAPRAMPRRSI